MLKVERGINMEKIRKARTPFSPIESGYQEERIDILNIHFLRMLEKKEIISASYCLSRNNKVFADAALGSLSYDEKDSREFMPDTIFRIASITKLFTAISILKLVEDGKMRLDQCVGEFIEEFNTPPFDKINIVHLLTHTSGLIADGGVYPNKYYEGWWQSVGEEQADKWVEAVLKKGLRTPPGKEWSYSTVGFMILGEVITRVSGEFCHDYIEKYIIKPCEMNDTCFGMKLEFIDRYNAITKWAAEGIEKFKSGEVIGRGAWDKIPSTGGGIYSTCSDLSKFGNMILNYGTYNGKRIIGRKAIEAMARIHTSTEVKSYCWGAPGVHRPYGLGPDVFVETNQSQLITPGIISHEGAGACALMIDHKENFVAVWTAQFHTPDWHAHGLRNVASIIWSGLM
jgi:CubicO group peptidase (beta-lactamase class C family)